MCVCVAVAAASRKESARAGLVAGRRRLMETVSVHSRRRLSPLMRRWVADGRKHRKGEEHPKLSSDCPGNGMDHVVVVVGTVVV